MLQFPIFTRSQKNHSATVDKKKTKMKHSLLTLAACAFVSALSAQTTITENDMAPVMTMLRIAKDTLPDTSLVHPGNIGANQTYNLAGLANNSVDTMNFSLPSFTPYGNLYPNCNRVIIQSPSASPTYAFCTQNSTGLYMNGGVADPGTGSPVNLTNTPAETNITFPSSLGTTFSNNFTSHAKFFYGQDPGIGFVLDSVEIISHIVKTSVIDGWGSVTTPAGTFNCARQTVLRTNVDSIYGYAMFPLFGWAFLISQTDSNRVYSYWANGIGYPVAQLTDAHEFGIITSGEYFLSTAIAEIQEHSNASLISVYPNPASDNINFNSKANSVSIIEIYDVNGQLISSQALMNANTSINVSAFSNGIYFYSAIDVNGNTIDRGKFSVAH